MIENFQYPFFFFFPFLLDSFHDFPGPVLVDAMQMADGVSFISWIDLLGKQRKIQISHHYRESGLLTWSAKSHHFVREQGEMKGAVGRGKSVNFGARNAPATHISFFFLTHIKGSNPNAQCNKRNTFYWISARRGICQSKFKSLSVHHKLCESQVA